MYRPAGYFPVIGGYCSNEAVVSFGETSPLGICHSAISCLFPRFCDGNDGKDGISEIFNTYARAKNFVALGSPLHPIFEDGV